MLPHEFFGLLGHAWRPFKNCLISKYWHFP